MFAAPAPSTTILSRMDQLRYSDRERMSRDGTLGPLEFTEGPSSLRVAIKSIYENAARSPVVGAQFDKRVTAHCTQHFGKQFWNVNSSAFGVADFVTSQYTAVNDVLDLVEIIADEAATKWTFNNEGVSRNLRADSEIETNFNRAFVRHRFGFRVSDGEVRRIGAPALDEAIVGPALLALSRPGWEAADRSFRDALHHRRGGPDERDAAITDAHAALEAAMKAAGLSGDRLSTLARSFRNSGIVLPQLEGVPEALDSLLKRSSSIRDSLGDAHGKPPDAQPVPDGIVDLAIHWTGAFIVYLSEAST